MQTIDVREDLGNQFPWDRIETTFTLVGDQSVLTETKRVFDTGVTRIDGIRTDDSRNPSTTFTDDPQPILDVVQFRTWEDGDLHGGQDTAPWARIEEETRRPGDSLLTEAGVVTNPVTGREITERTVTYDSGDETFFRFEDGVLRVKTIFDGPVNMNPFTPQIGQGNKAWFAVTQQFDASGDLSVKGIFYDNGITKGDEFSDGILVSRILSDGLYSTEDGIKPWSTIITQFDPNGLVTSELTIFDDDRRLEELFAEGRLMQTVLIVPQVPDQCSFSSTVACPDEPATLVSRTTDYDGTGRRTQQVTEFTDGDVTGFLFVDGEIAEKQFFDGDGDADWIVLRMLFENGERTDVITYDSLDLLPDEVIVAPDLPEQPSF